MPAAPAPAAFLGAPPDDDAVFLLTNRAQYKINKMFRQVNKTKIYQAALKQFCHFIYIFNILPLSDSASRPGADSLG